MGTYAVEMLRPDIVSLLLSHPNTDPNMIGLDGFTPLTLAVTKSSPEIVTVLLQSPGCDVNFREGGGMTALHLAVLYNNLTIVKLLLGDKRTLKCLKVEGKTALQLASDLDKPNQEILKMLE